MKNLFEERQIKEIKFRITNLTKNAIPIWGNMTAAQMMAHCSLVLENALGEKNYAIHPILKIHSIIFKAKNRARYISPMPFQPRVITKRKGGFLKKTLDKNPFKVTARRAFNQEKTVLLNWIDLFFQEGKEKTKMAVHPAYGKFTPEEWAIGQYKHLDYHLRQFDV